METKSFNYSEKLDQQILLPIKHTRPDLGSCNNIYLTLIKFLDHWMPIPDDKLTIIKEIILDLNTYTVIDDLLDHSAIRKGKPTTYRIFGITNTINGFDFQMCHTMEKVLKLNYPEAVSLYINEFRNTMAGQGIEVYWRDNFICPTEDEYIKIVLLKNCSWFRMLEEFMRMFSSRSKDIKMLSAAFALYAQINDDYNCLTNTEYFKWKGFYEDFTEGKFNFVIVHAINSHPEEKQAIIDILKEHTTDIAVLKHGVSILEKCGSFEYTLNKLQELKHTIIEELHELGENPHIDHLFACLCETH